MTVEEVAIRTRINGKGECHTIWFATRPDRGAWSLCASELNPRQVEAPSLTVGI